MPARRWTDEQLRAAVPSAMCLSDVLRALGMRPAGGSHRTVASAIARLGLDTSHFDPAARRTRNLARRTAVPLEEVLVEGSSYSRARLKQRLIATGLLDARCALCGQDGTWRGQPMALVLDHVNGVWNDNRLENLRIVCPNCNATLDTHCGRKNRRTLDCVRCGEPFTPRTGSQRYCSSFCGSRHDARARADAARAQRRVERPPHTQLLEEVRRDGFAATGRRYGVSDNAIRKWVRAGEGPDGPSSEARPTMAP